MRVELPDGQWAELRERLSYEQDASITRAYIEATQDAPAMVNIDPAVVRAYLVNWNVLGLDGAALPIADVEKAPADVLKAIAKEADRLWTAANRDPKGKPAKGRSGSTLRAVR